MKFSCSPRFLVAALVAARPSRNPNLLTLVLVLLLLVACAAGAAVSQAQSACVPPPSGAVAWWPFDESVGPTAADIIGGRNGTDYGFVEPPVPAPGEVGNALEFFGFTGYSYVAVPNDPVWTLGSNDFSIELWANLATTGGNLIQPGDIFIGHDEGPDNQNKWFFALGGGYLFFHINSPTLGPQRFPLIPFAPTANTWYHLTVTRSGSLYSIYIDGSLAGTATNSETIPAAQAILTIGQAEDLGFVDGRLDEVTIYDRALTAQEVHSIWAAGSAGKCKPGIAVQVQSFCQLLRADATFHRIAVVSATDTASVVSTLSVTVTRNGHPVNPADIQNEGTQISPRTISLKINARPHGESDDDDHHGVNEYRLTAVGTDAAGNSATAVASCSVKEPPSAAGKEP